MNEWFHAMYNHPKLSCAARTRDTSVPDRPSRRGEPAGEFLTP